MVLMSVGMNSSIMMAVKSFFCIKFFDKQVRADSIDPDQTAPPRRGVV